MFNKLVPHILRTCEVIAVDKVKPV